MAFQFVPGYREANSLTGGQQELSMPGLLEEVKKKVNRPVTDLALAEETTILVRPQATSGGNGNGHGHTAGAHSENLTVRTTINLIVNQQDAPSCPNCGHIAVRNGACYKCLNCGESLGCS